MNLSEEQRKIVKNNESGIFKVSGPAGSGKTLVSVKRAIYLLTEYVFKKNDDNILFLYQNPNLIEVIKNMLDKELINISENIKNKIEFYNIDDFILKKIFNENIKFKNFILSKKENKKEIFTEDDVSKLLKIEDICRNYNLKEIKMGFGENYSSFLLEEFDWIRSCMFSRKDYLEKERTGRGNSKKINTEKRKLVLKLLTEYRKDKNNNFFIDYYDCLTAFIKHDEFNESVPKYTHIIIDEAQDFSRLQLELIKKIYLNQKHSNLLLLNDSRQRISKNFWYYGKERSFENLGFEIPKENSFYLKEFYRTPECVFRSAKKVFLSNEEKKREETSLFKNTKNHKPIFFTLKSKEEELAYIIKYINKSLEEKIKFENITVICSDLKEAKNIENIFYNYYCSYLELEMDRDERYKMNNNFIKVTTFQESRGFENDIVFIKSLNKDFIQQFPQKNMDDLEYAKYVKKLLFIGMTRACKLLIMSSYNGITNLINFSMEDYNLNNIEHSCDWETLFIDE